MLIKELSQLNSDIIKEVRDVEKICRDFDGLSGSIYLDTSFNFNKHIKSIFSMYEGSKLVSVLSMFIPTRNEAEISAYTLPDYRNRGYFKELFQKAVNELKKYEVEDILIVCEAQSKPGKKVAKHLEAKYDFTEYFMRYTYPSYPSLGNCKCRSVLCTPGIEDLDILVNMSRNIYNDNHEGAKSILQNTFESEDRIQYATVFENKYVGIGSACFDGDQTSIYGLGILPEYQGRGLGKELLVQILIDLMKRNRNNINLEVNSTNEKAFKMYKNNGFQVEVAYDYYRKEI